MIDATKTQLGLGELLIRAPAELGFCKTEATKQAQVWEVVITGGIVVSEGKETSSRRFRERLCTGSLVKMLELESGRLHYEIITGTGPELGWVNTSLDGNELIVKINNDSVTARDKAAPMKEPVPEQDPVKVKDALQEYSRRFMKEVEGADGLMFYNRQAFPWTMDEAPAEEANAKPEAEVRQELAEELEKSAAAIMEEASSAPKEEVTKVLDSDGEELRLCCACHLPLGDNMYESHDKKGCVHAECAAQHAILDMKGEEEKRVEKEKRKKMLRHAEYDIGWKAERVPHNAGAAATLAGRPVPEGLCCLVLDESTGHVGVAPTMDPAASVNLEYLSIALQVRVKEGREPEFSLDPVDAKAQNSMQVKRFEPYWLKGTSMGDVLFQSDYHLKELSMGQYEQPVVGMKSCFDFSEEEGIEKEWAAREWFIVKKAEVQITEDNVLLPYCKMGVEAREQIVDEKGQLQDLKVTRQNHPMVKYAEEFTHNFDLIAERKSVIYHLREVAKASILAKFLVEAEIDLEPIWFELCGETKMPCPLEIPQLWNEAASSQIQVDDGKIVDGIGSRMHAIHGGVRFGLDRFSITPAPGAGISASRGTARMGFGARPAQGQRAVPVLGRRPAAGAPIATRPGLGLGQRPVAGAPIAARASQLRVPGRGQLPAGVASPLGVARGQPIRQPIVPPRSLGLSQFRVAPSAGIRGATFAGRGIPARFMPGRLTISPSLRMGLPLPMSPSLRGVDLNLSSFDLSMPNRVAREKAILGDDLSACVAVANAFWPTLDQDDESIFKSEEKKLLKDVFNPVLSDRRDDGVIFAPPDAAFDYMQKLKSLLQEEKNVRERRKERFFSASFVASSPGPLFPSSWMPAFGITHSTAPAKSPAKKWLSRPEYKAQAALFDRVLKSATPIFEKRTEDGLAFRIYNLGSLEVRTIQEHDGQEEIGAVFSCSSPAQGTAMSVKDEEKVAKVIECVEHDAQHDGKMPYRYFVVMETEQGKVVVTEMLQDGTTTWEENPKCLEDRISLSKVLRSAECLRECITIGKVKKYQVSVSQTINDFPSSCKRYAYRAYSRAGGYASNTPAPKAAVTKATELKTITA